MSKLRGQTDAGAPRHGWLSSLTEQLLDSAPDAFVLVDGEGTVLLVNKQAEALFGYERDELAGCPVDDLVPDRARPLHQGRRESYFANPTVRPTGAGLDLSARRKDGSEFPVDISLSWLSTDRGVVVLAAVRDITERRNNLLGGIMNDAGLAVANLGDEVTALWPGTKVLYMSGYSHDVIAHQGVVAEGIDLIETPFTADSLITKVHGVLER